MKSRWFLFLLCLVGFLYHSCDNTPQQVVSTEDPRLKESLEKANRYLTNDEEEDIQNYISRHHLDMQATGTGLRYQIVKKGDGALIQPGQRVTLEYVLYNIMGDVVYSSENDGIKNFDAGCGDVEKGLDEAILHLHEGDVAKVIIPSHLGYGLLGDHNRIPERATLIYTLNIVKVK